MLWPVWGGVGYYSERMDLIKRGMPAPRSWTVEDWVTAALIADELEALIRAEAQESR